MRRAAPSDPRRRGCVGRRHLLRASRRARCRRHAGGQGLGGVQGASDPHPRVREDHVGAQPDQLHPDRLQLCHRRARHLRPRYRRAETLPGRLGPPH